MEPENNFVAGETIGCRCGILGYSTQMTSIKNNSKAAPVTNFISLADVMERLETSRDPGDAWSALLDRLKTGVVETRAAVIRLIYRDGDSEVERDAKVDASVWAEYHNVRAVDPKAGRINAEYEHPDDGLVTVELHGLQLVEGDVADILRESKIDKRGRLPGAFWPAFAEELAVWAHDTGPPSLGTPVIGVIDQIFDRMSARGIEPPVSRTVQDAVRRAIERMQAV
jgi:hypothetical protein